MTSIDHTPALSELLAHLSGTVNLVFHDIAPAADQLWSRYDTTTAALHQIIGWCRDQGVTQQTRLYFDDNRRSVFDLVLPRVDVTEFAEIVIAVPVTTIGRNGRGTTTDLRAATARGVRIAAHGWSHIRLAAYDRTGTLLATPLGGHYRDRPGGGPHEPLTDNEALFQLVEAKEHLEPITGPCREFVLPHGCYNATTVALNQRFGLYDHLATTDPGLDTGQLLRPRFPVGADDTALTLADRITDEVRIPWPDSE